MLEQWSNRGQIVVKQLSNMAGKRRRDSGPILRARAGQAAGQEAAGLRADTARLESTAQVPNSSGQIVVKCRIVVKWWSNSEGGSKPRSNIWLRADAARLSRRRRCRMVVKRWSNAE